MRECESKDTLLLRHRRHLTPLLLASAGRLTLPSSWMLRHGNSHLPRSIGSCEHGGHVTLQGCVRRLRRQGRATHRLGDVVAGLLARLDVGVVLRHVDSRKKREPSRQPLQ